MQGCSSVGAVMMRVLGEVIRQCPHLLGDAAGFACLSRARLQRVLRFRLSGPRPLHRSCMSVETAPPEPRPALNASGPQDLTESTRTCAPGRRRASPPPSRRPNRACRSLALAHGLDEMSAFFETKGSTSVFNSSDVLLRLHRHLDFVRAGKRLGNTTRPPGIPILGRPSPRHLRQRGRAPSRSSRRRRCGRPRAAARKSR